MTEHPIAPPQDGGFRHGFETIEGLRLHYVRAGREDAKPVVLLAGYPETWYAWRRVVPLLSDRFHVVAIDLPGQGDSDKPLEGYDTSTVARRVHALIAQLGLKRYAIAAHDVGAWVAFPYGLLFGDEITRLALLDAGIPGVTLPDMLPTVPDKAWRTWHFAFHTVPDLPEALIEGKERIYLDWFLRRKTANPLSFGEADLDEYVRAFTLPGALRAGLAFYRAAQQSAEQNMVLTKGAKLPMPVLAVSADQGSIPDMAAPLRPFANDLRGETIQRSGHFIPEEPPEVLANLLSRFFGG